MKRVSAFAYLGDVLLFRKSFRKQMAHLETLFHPVKKATSSHTSSSSALSEGSLLVGLFFS